jgi:hypothetical protein
MADDLVSRLSATLDEAERVAQAIPESSGQRIWDTSESGDVIDDYGRPVAVGAWDGDLGEVGRHIARWDPEAVLRLVAAHREIIEKYRTAQTTVKVSDGTILAGAMKVNLRAYGEMLKLVARGWGIGDKED